MTLEPCYHGLPPAEAVAEHASSKSGFNDPDLMGPGERCGMWMFVNQHTRCAHFLWLMVDTAGVVRFLNNRDDTWVDINNVVTKFLWEDDTSSPCHPNGWPVAAITPESHAAAAEAAYREGAADGKLGYSADEDWQASNARAALPPAGVALVTSRKPTPDEIRRGLELEPLAQECLARPAVFPAPESMGGEWRGKDELQSVRDGVTDTDVDPVRYIETPMVRSMVEIMHQCRYDGRDFLELLRKAAALHRQERDAAGDQ